MGPAAAIYTFRLRTLYADESTPPETRKLSDQSRRSFVAGLAAQYGDRVRRYLHIRARNSADLPDLAQEVFLRLMRVDGHELIRCPEAYLFTVARHVAHQHRLQEANAPRVVEITEVFPELQVNASDDLQSPSV